MTRGASPAVRNRAKSIFVGLALTCTDRGGVAVRVARWRRPRSCSPPTWRWCCSALFPALIAYAILKRNLFDLDAVLRASLVYGVATALVLGVYFAAVAVASHFATILVGQSFAVALTLAVAVAVPSAAPGRAAHRRQAALSRQPHAGAARALARAAVGAKTSRRWPRWRSGRCLRLTRARGVRPVRAVARSVGSTSAGRAGEAGEEAAHLPLGGGFERALAGDPRPQAVRDLGEEAATERGYLGGSGIELLVPLVGRGRARRRARVRRRRAAASMATASCTRSPTPRRSWRWRWRTRRWWPSARCASGWRRSGSWRR